MKFVSRDFAIMISKAPFNIDLDFESSPMATYYKKLVCTAILAEDLYQSHISSGIFPSTFLQPLNGSISILNWVMKLNLFLCFFIFLFLKHPWKIFLSIHLFLTLWFRYLQTLIKEKCMYLSSQLFFKTNHEILNFQQKSKKNAFSSDLQTQISKNFPFSAYHGATSRSHWTKPTVKKQGKTAVDKSAWIKTCSCVYQISLKFDSF